MPKFKTKPSLVFLLFAILVGGYLRFSQNINTKFPVNDGGLFYSMTIDLQTNHYHIPATTTYNNLDLPFAYPPLGFYLASLLADLTGWSLLNIFRLLPAFIILLTIPAFYIFARDFTDSDLHLSLAIIIFPLIPATFDWLIMGGGITRAPGFLFSILTLCSVYRLFTRKQIRYIFLTSLLASATVLSHPEAALQTAVSALVFWAFLGRSKSGILKSLVVAGLTLLITSPWWATVIHNHGLTPFLAAGGAGWHSFRSILRVFNFDFTGEVGLTTIGVLALTGLVIALAKRKFFLPTLAIVTYISEPRSAPLYLTLVFAIVGASALQEILILLSRLDTHKKEPTTEPALFAGTANRVLIVFLLVHWILATYSAIFNLASAHSLASADIPAFAWVHDNTPIGSQFLILTGQPPLGDPVSEWFPALTGRTSIATIQGQEWNSLQAFDDALQQDTQIQQCLAQNQKCLSDWFAATHTAPDYIFIQNAAASGSTALTDTLISSGEFSRVYQTPEISILQRK
jgi:hypothetical protein